MYVRKWPMKFQVIIFYHIVIYFDSFMVNYKTFIMHINNVLNSAL